MLCAPTAFGKSTLMQEMLSKTSKQVLILVHREELLEKNADDLKHAGIPHGIISSRGAPLRHTHRFQIGMMQTVTRRLEGLQGFDFVISDEAHLAMSPSWLTILEHFKDAWHLGMSATPCRLDGQGLGLFYDHIVYGPSPAELTTRGYLCPMRTFAPPAQVDGQWDPHKSWSTAKKAEFLNRPAITGSAVAEFKRLGRGHQAVVFCTDRKHAENVAEEFCKAGVRAINVDGTMGVERKQRLKSFVARELDVIVNVDLLTTGWDCPQVDVGIDLAATESLALDVQKHGRVIRISPGKEMAYWLDLVGNTFRHGLYDAKREWTLEGRAKRHTAPPVRQCPNCYAAFMPAPKCPACQYVFPIASPKTPVRRGGSNVSLQEIAAADVEERQRYLRETPLKVLTKAAHTMEALREIQVARGFKPGWAAFMMGIKAKGRAKFYGGAKARR